MTSSLLSQRLASNNEDGNTIDAIVFALADIEQTPMANYLFAMPVAAVEKAIVYPSERAVLRDGIGIMNLGAETLTIVDLRQKFASIDPLQDSSKFLILFHTHAGELCALPIKDAPVLMDIDPAMIRSLPLAYREVNQLSFISQMAIVPQEGNLAPLQILLIGFDPIDPNRSNRSSHLN
ncbi:chemotaxis protein CheW [Chamaesiphon minutus]|uniref:Chemotaxis protein histidine kinase-like protein n=1 Tax=Chamaesiphon minutus (strain ATCC 27169 / PCC 6605) TaxID=1173020 RepID=K9UMQ7_CHAP6|nr:chemotaxis protein CheW [Chamaesiphon minutus]AFY96377.1 chemotaxis protein histidine kinase-like protein [Chamaesiphon minutus PCC 6605]